MNKILVACLVSFAVHAALGQNTRSTETPRPPAPTYQSQKKEKKGLFVSKKKKTKPGKSEVEEFRNNLKKVYKKKAKEERLAEKPRYSDPSYFGHKKPPKKRPPGKQKFCKVCRIKH